MYGTRKICLVSVVSLWIDIDGTGDGKAGPGRPKTESAYSAEEVDDVETSVLANVGYSV